MSLTIVFVIVLAVCFAIAFFLIQSDQTQKAVQKQLASLSEQPKTKAIENTVLKHEKLSPNPALDDLLRKIPGTLRLFNLTRQAGVQWWVSSIVLGSAFSGFVGAVLLSIRTENVVFILIGAVVSACIPTAHLLILRRKRLQACDALLPQAIDLLVRALRAGHALNSAIEMVSHDVPQPLAGEFRKVYEQQALGLPMRDALIDLTQRIPRDDIRFVTTAMLLQKETGGNLVQVLDNTSRLMRERTRVRGQIRIYTAQARATSWVVSGLPAVMFLLMSVVHPGYEKIMLDDPVGSMVFYTGCVFWGIGILAIRKLVAIKL